MSSTSSSSSSSLTMSGSNNSAHRIQIQQDATLKESKPPLHGSPRNILYAIIACGLYLVVGPSLIFHNQQLMVKGNFPYPATLSSLGLISSSIMSILAIRVFKLETLKFEKEMTSWFYLTRIVPIALLLNLTLLCGNAAYLYLSVSLIQMLKAFTPAMVLYLGWVSGVNRPTPMLVFSTLTICFGCSLTSIGAVEYSTIGFLLVFFAGFFESVRLVMIESLLGSQGFKFSVIEGLYWISPATVVWTWAIFIPLFEAKDMIANNAISVVIDNPWKFFWSAILGFAVNVAGFLVIRTTNALILKILASTRNLTVIAYSVLILGEIVMPSQYLGLVISLLGFGYFNYLHMKKLAEYPTPSSKNESLKKDRL